MSRGGVGWNRVRLGKVNAPSLKMHSYCANNLVLVPLSSDQGVVVQLVFKPTHPGCGFRLNSMLRLFRVRVHHALQQPLKDRVKCPLHLKKGRRETTAIWGLSFLARTLSLVGCFRNQKEQQPSWRQTSFSRMPGSCFMAPSMFRLPIQQKGQTTSLITSTMTFFLRQAKAREEAEGKGKERKQSGQRGVRE